MRWTLVLLVVAVLPPGATPSHAAREDKSRVLTFEAASSRAPLDEWRGWPRGAASTLLLDSLVVHEGRYAGRIERDSTSPESFSSFGLELPVDFGGDTLELRGWLRLEGVEGTAGLWQRQDGKSGTTRFDNMQSRQLRGTRDWDEYRVALPRDPKSRRVTVGALLSGTGRLWVDDLRIYVDGRPLAEVPLVEPIPTVLETDREFDAGSKVETTRLSPAQAANLALLGKVWGFLKYHHPAVIAGRHHWDYELFRVLPRVLAAPGAAEARGALAAWVASLGEVPPCSSCVELPPGRPVAPRLAWLSDRSLLGAELSARLREIHARRPRVDEQFYVTFARRVGNPDFSVELAYANLREPDTGYRLLALFRFWNMVEYWFPYRDVMDEDWDATLREFVPRLAAAGDSTSYASTLMALIARVHDTHANLWGSLHLRPPRGRAQAPVSVRFVEGRAVVTGWTNPRLGPGSGLRAGDVIESIDGTPVDTLVARWRPMYAASNEAARLRDMARVITCGDSGLARLVVTRDGSRFALGVPRVPSDSLDKASESRHDHPGPAFRRLSDEVAYLKLSSVKAAETGAYLKGAAGAKLLLIDIRNYPSEFMVFALGQHLVREPTPFATFTRADALNPGSFDWSEPVTLQPKAPFFEGEVAILVDEVSQSQAEYTTMAFRARPGALVVGSTTSGADGNVSPIPLPGGLRSLFSGIGVFHPDRKPTQRIGIVPDVVARPTLAGIREGRDEVLEGAVRRALGREITPAEYASLRNGRPGLP